MRLLSQHTTNMKNKQRHDVPTSKRVRDLLPKLHLDSKLILEILSCPEKHDTLWIFEAVALLGDNVYD